MVNKIWKKCLHAIKYCKLHVVTINQKDRLVAREVARQSFVLEKTDFSKRTWLKHLGGAIKYCKLHVVSMNHKDRLVAREVVRQ